MTDSSPPKAFRYLVDLSEDEYHLVKARNVGKICVLDVRVFEIPDYAFQDYEHLKEPLRYTGISINL